jgi:hypothetical protein
VVDIAEALPRTRINHLKLNKTAMNTDFFRALCNALPSSVFLETLEVAGNDLDDLAISCFSSVVPHCLKLRNVNFSHNKIQDLRELNAALKANTMLEYISFQSNAEISNVMAMELVEGTLRSHSSLTRIDLAHHGGRCLPSPGGGKTFKAAQPALHEPRDSELHNDLSLVTQVSAG